MNKQETTWLILIYQLPKSPGAVRVRIWRRLQRIGAVAVKNSVYVLPRNDQTLEDFQWTLADLNEGGGEGAILEARFVAGLTTAQLTGMFNEVRDADYDALVKEIEAYAANQQSATQSSEESHEHMLRHLPRVRARFSEIESIDFFGASRRSAAVAAIRRIAHGDSNATTKKMEGAEMKMLDIVSMKKRIWVTRRNVRIDRIACTWLIRRWIDPEAQFRFVEEKDHVPAEGEIRFDMFEGEFTHQGDMCTFEILAQHARPDDAALKAIAEIVHDMDLKDGKFGRAEVDGVATLLAGIVARFDDDFKRIERGAEMFDDIYRSLSESAHGRQQ